MLIAPTHFDIAFIQYINQFAYHSKQFDKLVVLLSHNYLPKGGVFVLLISWGWFKANERQALNRSLIVATFFSSLMAEFITRVISILAPFRFRPEQDQNLNFILPYNATPGIMDGWSSFPSDHAALFFALSTGLLFISRKVGIFALLYTVIFIALPRTYMGLHYPSDLIAGALIGIASAVCTNVYMSRSNIVQFVTKSADSHPEYFYPLFVLSWCQVYELFWSARELVSRVPGFLKGMLAYIYGT